MQAAAVLSREAREKVAAGLTAAAEASTRAQEAATKALEAATATEEAALAQFVDTAAVLSSARPAGWEGAGGVYVQQPRSQVFLIACSHRQC